MVILATINDDRLKINGSCLGSILPLLPTGTYLVFRCDRFLSLLRASRSPIKRSICWSRARVALLIPRLQVSRLQVSRLQTPS